jgi:hypothetical protein
MTRWYHPAFNTDLVERGTPTPARIASESHSTMKPLSLLLIALAVSLRTYSAEPLKLNSGKEIKILAVGPLQSTVGWSGLMLKYRTEVPMSDIGALRIEADEIWDHMVVDAEHGNYRTAVINANGPETGRIVTTNSSYNFGFQKRNGSWRTNEATGQQLDKTFVREFFQRLDAADDYGEANAMLLYLSKDWTFTLKNPSAAGGAQTQVLDGLTVANAARATFLAASSRTHTRRILHIEIAPDGKSGSVRSHETEHIVLKGKQNDLSCSSMDWFEFRDGSMTLTKSESVLDSQSEKPAE